MKLVTVSVSVFLVVAGAAAFLLFAPPSAASDLVLAQVHNEQGHVVRLGSGGTSQETAMFVLGKLEAEGYFDEPAPTVTVNNTPLGLQIDFLVTAAAYENPAAQTWLPDFGADVDLRLCRTLADCVSHGERAVEEAVKLIR